RNMARGTISTRKPGTRKAMMVNSTPGSSCPAAACARYLMKRPLMMMISSTPLTAASVVNTSRLRYRNTITLCFLESGALWASVNRPECCTALLCRNDCSPPPQAGRDGQHYRSIHLICLGEYHGVQRQTRRTGNHQNRLPGGRH